MALSKSTVLLFLLPVLLSCKEKAPRPVDNQTFFGLHAFGYAGTAVDLNEIKSKKAAVFFFLSPDCPLCQSYTHLIRDLSQRYSPQGIAFYGVFPGSQYSAVEIRDFMDTYKLQPSFRDILDLHFRITAWFGAKITPEVFVLNNKGAILYQGRIDDQAWDTGQKKIKASHRDLEEALALIAKGNVSFSKKTEAIGCLIEK
jgi:thiol-disulfide isomerase/thioredoxin